MAAPGTPEWINDWTAPSPAPVSAPPAWQVDINQALADGYDQLSTVCAKPSPHQPMSAENQIALAQAHYLRAIAMALAETAQHAEGVVDQLAAVERSVDLLHESVDHLREGAESVAEAVAEVKKSRWWHLWTR